MVCVVVVLENLVTPEERWLKIVPEHSGLGPNVGEVGVGRGGGTGRKGAEGSL